MEHMFNQINSLVDVKTSTSILDNINATAIDSGAPFVIDANTFATTPAAAVVAVEPNLTTTNIANEQEQGKDIYFSFLTKGAAKGQTKIN